MVPGPETDKICRKAKQRNVYVSFEAHTEEPDWPGHFFNCSILVGPDGEIIYTHWKNPGYAGAGEYATTVFEVLDEYVKRNGWDAVWPVARTPIGNLASYVCAEGFRPEPARIYASKGAEILLRNFAGNGYGNKGGKLTRQFIADCAFNDVWGVLANAGTNLPGPQSDPETSWYGTTIIVNPWGEIVAESAGVGEEIVYATIPIAEFRTDDNRFGACPGAFQEPCKSPHRSPNYSSGGIRTELYMPDYISRPGRFPPNLYTKYQKKNKGELPPSVIDACCWLSENARWDADPLFCETIPYPFSPCGPGSP
jgi:predicted amidohydrolase